MLEKEPGFVYGIDCGGSTLDGGYGSKDWLRMSFDTVDGSSSEWLQGSVIYDKFSLTDLQTPEM